jgi:predicted DNA-binding transcriptional regulator AlpA
MRGLLAIVDHPAQADQGLKEWSTAEELCAWLGITKPTLNWLNMTGQGPRRHRVGKRNLYRRGDVEKWLTTRHAAAGHR